MGNRVKMQRERHNKERRKQYKHIQERQQLSERKRARIMAYDDKQKKMAQQNQMDERDEAVEELMPALTDIYLQAVPSTTAMAFDEDGIRAVAKLCWETWGAQR